LRIIYLGYSFAGGTTDGPGAFDFVQGDNSSNPQCVLDIKYVSITLIDYLFRNPFWQVVKGAVTPYPNAEQIACQHPKPILLNTVRYSEALR
jgi:neutral ceramidase